MKIEFKKTTVGEINNHNCGTRNNCYYKGGIGVRWEIIVDDVPICATKTKKHGLSVLKWAQENYDKYDGHEVGDPTMRYYADTNDDTDFEY